MPLQARIALTLGLAAALIAAAGCGGSSSTGAGRPAASPAGSTTPATAGSASSGSAPAGDRFAALPPCNVFPDSLSGTFQGNLIQMTPTAKPGDTWTAAAACLGMLAGPQRPLSIEVFLFSGRPDQDAALAAAYGRSKGAGGTSDPGWGGDGSVWTASACQRVAWVGNVVTIFKELSVTPTCKTELDRVAHAYVDMNLR